MKKITLLMIVIITLATAFNAKGQTGKKKFTYSYDDAGNRIKRTYDLVPCPSCFLRIAKTDSIKIIDSLLAIAQDIEIKLPETPTEKLISDGTVELKNVYPNPTRGNFLLQFNNLLLNGKLQIFDIHGNKLEEMILNGIEFQIDLSLHPSGEYLLNINLPNGKTYNKKIVKI